MQIIAATFFTAVIIWLSGVPVAAQSAYPDRPVRIIVTFAPGSATDITARVIAQKLSVAWGVAVTIENIPGSGGVVGPDRIAKATPDGYTLGWIANGALTIAPALQGKLPYDSARDFAPISQVLVMSSIVAVDSSANAPPPDPLRSPSTAQAQPAPPRWPTSTLTGWHLLPSMKQVPMPSLVTPQV